MKETIATIIFLTIYAATYWYAYQKGFNHGINIRDIIIEEIED